MILFKETQTHAHMYMIHRFDQAFIIDPSHDYEALMMQLENYTLKGLLITHAHQDHIDLLQKFNVPIYIHREDAHLLFLDQYNGYAPKTHPYHKKGMDIRLLEDQDRIEIADLYIEVIHTPGHTKGSCSFLFQNHLFTGDTLFKEDVGRHDLYSGYLPDLKRSVLRLMTLNPNLKICPGHGDASTVRYEMKKNPYFLKWRKQKT